MCPTRSYGQHRGGPLLMTPFLSQTGEMFWQTQATHVLHGRALILVVVIKYYKNISLVQVSLDKSQLGASQLIDVVAPI